MNTKSILKICPECGKRFVRMRRVALRRGKYTLTWNTRVVYCSPACRQAAYRTRKKREAIRRVLFPQ